MTQIELNAKLNRLVGQKCVSFFVTPEKCLGVLLGEYDKSIDVSSHLWKIGTYYCGWRIVKESRVLCGRDDVWENYQELRDHLNGLTLGNFVGIHQISELDIRVVFSCGTTIDFLGTTREKDDDIIHVFMPDHEMAKYTIDHGWQFSRTDKSPTLDSLEV